MTRTCFHSLVALNWIFFVAHKRAVPPQVKRFRSQWIRKVWIPSASYKNRYSLKLVEHSVAQFSWPSSWFILKCCDIDILIRKKNRQKYTETSNIRTPIEMSPSEKIVVSFTKKSILMVFWEKNHHESRNAFWWECGYIDLGQSWTVVFREFIRCVLTSHLQI